MGRSAGTGSPVWFHCWGERTAPRYKDEPRVRHEVELTGRQKPYRSTRSRGTRSTRVSREYRCLLCGHVGWSNHVDLESIA